MLDVCCLFIVDWLVSCVVVGYLCVAGCGGWLIALFLCEVGLLFDCLCCLICVGIVGVVCLRVCGYD